MRILSATDIRALISMREAIAAVHDGFIALSDGRVVAPVRGAMETPGGTVLTMPAYINGDDLIVMKQVNVFPGNPATGLPTIHAVVLVSSAQTGELLMMAEGSTFTALRTGAGSGVATDLLARQDASVLGVIGTGRQARTQVEAVCAVRDINEIRLYSRTDPGQMADEILGQYGAAVTVAGSAREAAAGADVIVTATNSSAPVLHLGDVAPGVHVNGVGSFKPEMQEIDADLITAPGAKVVVDHRESAWEEAGDLIIPRDAGQFAETDIYAEVGEIAAGSQPGRVSDDEITIFKSVGHAVQDAVLARVLLAALPGNPEVGQAASL